MVYIPARMIKTTVRQAILDHLWCADRDKAILMRHIEKGDGVAIFIDAIDEVRDPSVMTNLQEFAHKRQTTGGPTFLISARTDECSVNTADFNRFLVLGGFTVDQGEAYVNQYFTGAHVPTHPAVDYVNRHSEKLQPVLCNPLRLYIFCALSLKGILHLEEGAKFDILNLFEPLEKFLTRREGGLITEEQASAFYKLCLYSLLSGMRELPESLLEKFHIARNYFVFLEKETTIDANAVTVTSYSFSHEMVHEYFAAKCVERMPLEDLKSLLLHVCCINSLRNIQKIMFELILKRHAQRDEIIRMMIRAILILQSPRTRKTHSGVPLDELSELRTRVSSAVTTEGIPLSHLTDQNLRETNDIWNTINQVFEVPGVNAGGWFCEEEMNGTLHHVVDCMAVCTPKEQQSILRDTVYALLPCTSEEHG